MCTYVYIIFETRKGIELSELWNNVFIWGVNYCRKEHNFIYLLLEIEKISLF